MILATSSASRWAAPSASCGTSSATVTIAGTQLTTPRVSPGASAIRSVLAALAPPLALHLARDGWDEPTILDAIELFKGHRDVGLARWAQKKGASPMADGPTAGDDEKVVSNDAFKKAQRRREAKEKREHEWKQKLGPGDETRQFGCEMRPNDKRPGLYSTSENGGWIAQALQGAGRGRSPAEKGGVPGMRGIVIAFKNCNGHEREVFLPNALLNGDVGKLTTVLSELGFALDHGDGRSQGSQAISRWLSPSRAHHRCAAHRVAD